MIPDFFTHSDFKCECGESFLKVAEIWCKKFKKINELIKRIDNQQVWDSCDKESLQVQGPLVVLVFSTSNFFTNKNSQGRKLSAV